MVTAASIVQPEDNGIPYRRLNLRLECHPEYYSYDAFRLKRRAEKCLHTAAFFVFCSFGAAPSYSSKLEYSLADEKSAHQHRKRTLLMKSVGVEAFRCTMCVAFSAAVACPSRRARTVVLRFDKGILHHAVYPVVELQKPS